jgi:hypothetical protein
LGKDISKIALLSEGDPHLDFKGVQHWEDRLKFIQSKVLGIKEEYRTKLDEQRNFWGFILALFSVFTFPAILSTGYWSGSPLRLLFLVSLSLSLSLQGNEFREHGGALS